MFREAFERLKQGNTMILPASSVVTQNNVAREANRDPSALRKHRYPLLVAEIQAYICTLKEEVKAKKRIRDNRSRTNRRKLGDSRAQISRLTSIVTSQNKYIEELLDEIDRLKSGKVVLLKP